MDIKRLVRVGGRWGVVLTVLGAINWGVRTAGDIDFVLQSVDDPGWLKAVAVALFVSPPWFVVMGLFVLSATALYLTRGGPSLPEGESEMGSKVVIKGGVMELADPEKAVIKPDENQQRIEDLEAERTRLGNKVFGLTKEVEELQAKVTEQDDEIRRIQAQLEPPAGPPPTESEKAAIDLLRIAFFDKGKLAAGMVVEQLKEIHDCVDGSNPLVPLLMEHWIKPFEEEIRSIEKAFDQHDLPSVDIQRSVARFIARYTLSVCWMHRSYRDPNFKVKSHMPHEAWKKAHEEFRNEIMRVTKSAALSRLRDSLEIPGSWAERFSGDDVRFPASDPTQSERNT